MQSFFPFCISVQIFCTVFLVRFYHLQFLQCGKSLIMILVYTGTDTGTFGSTYTTVSVIQFDCRVRYTCQRIPEHIAQEHISLTRMYLMDIHAHLLDKVHTVTEAEYDTVVSR